MTQRDGQLDLQQTVEAMRFESPVGHDAESLDRLGAAINAMDDREFGRFFDAYVGLTKRRE